MSKYVSPNGISGVSGYEQSLVFHYRMDVDRTMFGRWFVNVFDHGVLYYVPDPDTDTSPSTAGGTDITIKAGTSFLIKQKESTDGDIIAKGDMVKDYVIDVSGYAAATYSLIAIWENAAEEYRGVEFYLYTAAEIAVLDAAGYNYIKFGEVVISGGVIDSNTTTNQTQGSMYSGLAGWSGYSGTSGTSGWSGKSGYSGYSSYSGTSGYSGPSGYSGYSSDSGWSGYSSHSGYSGVSGWSGETPSVSECMIVAASDEITPITTGSAKVTFYIPYDFTLTKVKGTLNVASSSGTPTVDILCNSSSIFGANPRLIFTVGGANDTIIDSTLFAISNFSENDKIEVNVDVAGTGATGLKIMFIGTKA